MEETGEKLEFLRREEIRTMAKDMARLREEDAKKERERILALQAEKKTTPAPAPALEKPVQVGLAHQPASQPKEPKPEKEKIVPIPAAQEQASLNASGSEHQAPLIPPPYKPPSRLEKVLVRVAIASFFLFLIGNTIALGYYFFWRKGGQPAPIPQQEPIQQPSPDVPVPPESQPSAPPTSLINESNAISLEYGEISQIPELLSQFLKRVLPQRFTRVLLQNGQEYAPTETILEAFSIAPPQEIGSLLGNNTTVFVFSSNGKNHLGFVIEVNDTTQETSAMKAWESTLEHDTENLFGIMGEKGTGYVSFFRQTSYKQIPVRFQTLSNKDFGIVYAFLQNRLLLTGSLESMKALIDNITVQ